MVWGWIAGLIAGLRGRTSLPEPDRASVGAVQLSTLHVMADYAIASHVFPKRGFSLEACDDLCDSLVSRKTQLVYLEDSNDAFVAIDRELGAVVVSIPGSDRENIKDWLTNFRMKRRRFDRRKPSRGRVHSGFKSEFDAMRGRVEREVVRQLKKRPDLKCIVNGYSKGAAVATLFVAHLFPRLKQRFPERNWEEDLHLYALSSPRVGDQTWADHFDSLRLRHVTRYINGIDMVPHLPFKNGAYVHILGEQWEWKDGHVSVCKGRDDPECSRRVFSRGLGNLKKAYKDHLKLLGKAIPKLD